MHLNFEYPSVLFFALLALPAFVLFQIKLKKYFESAVVCFCRDEHTRKIFLLKKTIRAVCFALAWCLAVFGAAGPFYGNKTELLRKSGSEVVFVFDVSRSMLVSDVLPSRLASSAFCARNILDGLGGISAGIVLTKGDSVLAVPLTDDYSALYALTASLSPALVTAPGTGLASGLSVAASAFSRDRDNAAFVILFSDGGDPSADLLHAAFQLREKNITLIAVGAGTAEGMDLDVFPDETRTEMRRTVLNESGLKEAVEAAGGMSFFLRTTELGAAERILAAVSADDSGFVLVAGSQPLNRRSQVFVLALCFFLAGIAAGAYWRKKK